MTPDSPQTQEDVLLKRASEGDKQAFGVLYETYMDQIFRYIYYRVANSFEAEDLTENVFLNAWQAMPKMAAKDESLGNFRAWLYRIAHNLVVDHHRSNNPAISLDEALSLADPKAGPESATQTNQDSQQLAAAIGNLEPNLQQVLVCRFINQLSHSETAEIMKIEPGYVRVLQHRALKKMAELLAKEGK
jgi:RNA polymerase sigma-70 factor (ECF subfamily)